MLRLNITKEKQLTFEVQIGGVVDYDQVESFFRIVIEDVEYGFPCKVMQDSITVTLPPLNKVIGKKIKEGDEADIKLEVIADGHYLTPWRDRAKLSNPLVIEAKIKDSSFVKRPQLETKLVVDDGGEKQITTVQEKEIDPSDEIANKVIERLANILGPKMEQDGSAPLKSEGVDRKVDKVKDPALTSEAVEGLLSETIEKLNLTEVDKSKKKKKQITLTEFKRNLTKEDIYKYIRKVGTKNPKIQNIIYEQAVSKAGSGKPIEVLKQVIKVMKKGKK